MLTFVIKQVFLRNFFRIYRNILYVGVAFTESPWRLRTASTENNTKGVAFYYCQFHLKPPSIVSTCGSWCASVRSTVVGRLVDTSPLATPLLQTSNFCCYSRVVLGSSTFTHLICFITARLINSSWNTYNVLKITMLWKFLDL